MNKVRDEKDIVMDKAPSEDDFSGELPVLEHQHFPKPLQREKLLVMVEENKVCFYHR
ncbi:hypothetical protein MDA_GLEAN10000824 [Myotis davidii]|uniref:Uncharacterized protein n=1 Tax=Myotis davidii TaxID=225400 RepID=L5LW88_MYODS|nr:hypothetical protein MDA_GLEAN10000824 [Myotis davidii]